MAESNASEKRAEKLQISLNNQSIVLPVSEICLYTLTHFGGVLMVFVFHQQGEERIRISHLSPDGKLLEYAFEDAKTLYEAFLRGMRVSSRWLVH